MYIISHTSFCKLNDRYRLEKNSFKQFVIGESLFIYSPRLNCRITADFLERVYEPRPDSILQPRRAARLGNPPEKIPVNDDNRPCRRYDVVIHLRKGENHSLRRTESDGRILETIQQRRKQPAVPGLPIYY